jgi:hypothetical protein
MDTNLASFVDCLTIKAEESRRVVREYAEGLGNLKLPGQVLSCSHRLFRCAAIVDLAEGYLAKVKAGIHTIYEARAMVLKDLMYYARNPMVTTEPTAVLMHNLKQEERGLLLDEPFFMGV